MASIISLLIFLVVVLFIGTFILNEKEKELGGESMEPENDDRETAQAICGLIILLVAGTLIGILVYLLFCMEWWAK